MELPWRRRRAIVSRGSAVMDGLSMRPDGWRGIVLRERKSWAQSQDRGREDESHFPHAASPFVLIGRARVGAGFKFL